MKSVLFFIVFFLALNVMAQRNQVPYLICTDGLILNHYNIKNDAINPRIDTIPLLLARSVFAIGGISYMDNHFEKLIITDFILTIVHANGDTLKIPGKEAKLNKAMVDALKTIQPNTKIFVEGIHFTTSKEPELKGQLILMSFIAQ